MKRLFAITSVVILLLCLTTSCGRKGPDAPPDKTPPTIIATNPALGSVDVPSNTAISVTFSKAVDEKTISFLLTSTETGTVPCTMSYSDKTAIFTPSNALAYNTQYFATISAGVTDMLGNVMPAKYLWSFTTGTAPDTTPPAVLPDTLVPASETTNVFIFPNISATFSEPVNPSTVNSGTVKVSGNGSDVPGTVTLDSTGTKAIFMLSGPLLYDTTYTVTIVGGASGVKDMAGNALVANYTWNYTTEPPPPAPTYTLTVAKTGTGTGSVLPDTGTLSWIGNTGVGIYTSGTMVILTATAAAGSTFTGWSGCDSIVGATCVLNMTSAKNVTATFAINTYTITPSAGSNGSISPNTVQTVNYGATPSFTITPDTGYHVADVLVDSVSVGALTSYIFPSVTANHTISATFAINTYTITPSAGSNGSISPNTVQTVNYGATPSFTITPDTNYHVADVLVDGVSVGAPTSYTFPSVTANHTINASFAINQYNVSATAGSNGSLDASTPSPAIVDYNSTTNFTFSADTGYHVASVTDTCGGTGYANTSNSVATYTYTTPAITSDCTVSASFAIDTYTITVIPEPHGSVTCVPTVVDYGSISDCTITPQNNYSISAVSVDGVLQDPVVDSYTFTSVIANHTIHATFI